MRICMYIYIYIEAPTTGIHSDDSRVRTPLFLVTTLLRAVSLKTQRELFLATLLAMQAASGFHLTGALWRSS